MGGVVLWRMRDELGFIGLLASSFVGADVPDGPFHPDRIY